MSLATHHGESTASLFSSQEHRFSWETKRALTLSVDDEFPGTLETMVASRGDFPGSRAAVLASRAPPPCGPPTQPPPPPSSSPAAGRGPPSVRGPSLHCPSCCGAVPAADLCSRAAACSDLCSQPPCTCWIPDQASSAFCSCPRWPGSGGAVGGGSFAIDLVSGYRSFPVRLLRSYPTTTFPTLPPTP